MGAMVGVGVGIGTRVGLGMIVGIGGGVGVCGTGVTEGGGVAVGSCNTVDLGVGCNVTGLIVGVGTATVYLGRDSPHPVIATITNPTKMKVILIFNNLGN